MRCREDCELGTAVDASRALVDDVEEPDAVLAGRNRFIDSAHVPCGAVPVAPVVVLQEIVDLEQCGEHCGRQSNRTQEPAGIQDPTRRTVQLVELVIGIVFGIVFVSLRCLPRVLRIGARQHPSGNHRKPSRCVCPAIKVVRTELVLHQIKQLFARCGPLKNAHQEIMHPVAAVLGLLHQRLVCDYADVLWELLVGFPEPHQHCDDRSPLQPWIRFDLCDIRPGVLSRLCRVSSNKEGDPCVRRLVVVRPSQLHAESVAFQRPSAQSVPSSAVSHSLGKRQQGLPAKLVSPGSRAELHRGCRGVHLDQLVVGHPLGHCIRDDDRAVSAANLESDPLVRVLSLLEPDSCALGLNPIC